MSKRIKKKAKKTKKNIVAVIPIWCNWCNVCVIGILLLMTAGMFSGGGFNWFDGAVNDTDTTDDDDTDTTTTPPVIPDPDPLYKLAIQIYSWTHNDYVPEDMTFEVFDLATYTGVGSGIWYDDLHLSMWGSPWTYSEGSDHFVYGKTVAIDMFITPNNHELTVDSYLSTYVGAPEGTYAVYQNGVHCLDILLKWVVV